MAARKRQGLSENTRLRIKTTMLVERLQKHALGKCKMESTQIQAAKILLDRTLPTITESHVDGSIEHTHTHGGLSQTLGFLEGVVGTGAGDTPAEPNPNKPVLPAPLRTQ